MRSTFLQLGTAGLVVGGFVVLTLKGAETTGYVALVAPILAAVFVIQHLDHRTDKQDEQLAQQDEALAQITHQTNGVLTQRINDAVTEGIKVAVEDVRAELTRREDTSTE
ncbi:hypothetical protein OG381_34335 [Streptomyces sp. NBC_00490]|uniref:hypothetical protein n=1 Tax=Streptomyces sp. NBC_00490 TaxID=2903657 RepID=UPI002E18BF45